MKFSEITKLITNTSKEFHEFSKNLAIATAFLILAAQISAGKIVASSIIPFHYLQWLAFAFSTFLLLLNGLTVSLKLFSLFTDEIPNDNWGQLGWSITFYAFLLALYVLMIDVAISMTFVTKN
jgi:hypothetical protein